MFLLADSVLSRLNTAALQTPALGASLLGLVAGAIGSFAVLRRQSLQGDVVSHAALPGVALAFLLGAREPLALVQGAAVTGLLALVVVRFVTQRTRIPFDAALGGALAVFFGLGLVLMSYIQHHVPGGSTSPLDRYLFGQAALIRMSDLRAIALLGLAALVVLVLFWKELKLLSFDPDYAASLGRPVRLFDLVLTVLIVIAVVIGLKAVGVVLMTALLIAPAVAARQWTHRLGVLIVIAGGLGALAGAGGTIASHLLSDLPGMPTVPTGPTIVLTASAVVLFSLIFGSARGLAWTEWNSRARPAGRVESP
jgi:manganese/zinc/iron transport system permease protein